MVTACDAVILLGISAFTDKCEAVNIVGGCGGVGGGGTVKEVGIVSIAVGIAVLLSTVVAAQCPPKQLVC